MLKWYFYDEYSNSNIKFEKLIFSAQILEKEKIYDVQIF